MSDNRAEKRRAHRAALLAVDALRGRPVPREPLPVGLGARLIPESKRAPCKGQLTIEDA